MDTQTGWQEAATGDSDGECIMHLLQYDFGMFPAIVTDSRRTSDPVKKFLFFFGAERDPVG